MKKKTLELAIAIDTQALGRVGSTECNPYICAVPTGLSAQEVMELVYEQAREEYAQDAEEYHPGEEEPFPWSYDYLWRGTIQHGVVYGGECTHFEDRHGD
jgi:hypothetical protein